MKYEPLAFDSKDKELVKEHGQAVVMFVFLVLFESSKTATMPEGLSGDHLQN